MNLFNENSYRSALKNLVEERKSLDHTMNFQRLADAIRVPKSYLSNVIHGKADLSTDQAFLAADFLSLDPQERSYLLLLLDHERCSIKKRKDLLKKQIKEIQNERLQTKAHIKAKVFDPAGEQFQSYFFDPLNHLVHVCMTVARFKGDPAAIAKALFMPLPRIMLSVTRLERLGLLQRNGSVYDVLIENVHLPPDSPVYQVWRSQMRTHSLQRLNLITGPSAYSFSVTFTASMALKEEIQQRFLKFLSEIEEDVAASAGEEALQMNFDLFPWTSTSIHGGG